MAASLGPLTRQIQALLARGGLAEAARVLAAAALPPALPPANNPANLAASADRQHAEGLLALANNDFPSAVRALSAARALAPDSGWIACDLGRALLAAGQANAALDPLEAATRLEPKHLQAWLSLGLAAEGAGQFERAAETWTHAAALDARQPAAPYNLGNLAYHRGARELARQHYETALRRQPAFAQAWSALGSLEHDACNWPAAEKALRRAIELDPGWSAPRETLAHVLLGQARWQEGWQCYAWRASRVGVGARLPRPAEVTAMPSPAQLSGLKVLVAGEQGLGDVLFFLRWLPRLAGTVAALGFWGDERLFPLLGAAPLSLRLPQTQPVPPGWVALRSGDLPLVLDPAGRQLPSPFALPPAEAPLRSELEALLASLGPPPYIGLTWRAGTAGNREALAKQVPPALLGAALTSVKGTLISVQRLPESAEMATLSRATGRPVADLSALNADLPRIAALMQLLDAYVAVSNTNVHLRAGHGKPSIVLVPEPPEWRWGQQGDHSPWYPGCSVLRQRAGDWQAALARLPMLLSSQPN